MKEANSNKRVILIKGGKSNWYEQAIFIVRKNTARENMPLDFVQEAEKIVESYIDTHNAVEDNSMFAQKNMQYAIADSNIKYSTKTRRSRKRNRSFDRKLNIAILMGFIFLATVLVYYIIA